MTPPSDRRAAHREPDVPCPAPCPPAWQLGARNDICWADLGPPAGRRPVCVQTRDAAIEVLTSATCAPITGTVRGVRSEVELGPEHGLPGTCVISCDNVITIPLDDLDEPVGHLDEVTRARLDRALRYSLDIEY